VAFACLYLDLVVQVYHQLLQLLLLSRQLYLLLSHLHPSVLELRAVALGQLLLLRLQLYLLLSSVRPSVLESMAVVLEQQQEQQQEDPEGLEF
jgi:hypothetical protein